MNRCRALQRRSGQSLVEFAVVALVLYLLLAAILTFGHALYVAQGLQGAADLAAREISRTPLSVDIESLDDDDGYGNDALSNDDVRARVFDEAYLVIDLADFYSANPDGSVFTDIVPNLPLLNQQLATVMIVDRPDFDGDGEADAWYLRYPGALLSRTAIEPPAGKVYQSYVVADRTVGIPLVLGRDSDGVETVRWVNVVEEIEGDANPNPFDVDSTQGGLVALRINYPFQSASMSSFRRNEAGPFEPTLAEANLANDGGITETNAGDRPGDFIGQPLLGDNVYAGTHGGTFGLGAQGAARKMVRPYRRIISSQAIYRREVFQ